MRSDFLSISTSKKSSDLPSASAGCASAESEQAPFCSRLAQPFSQDDLQTDYTETLDGVLDFAYRDILLDEVHAGRGIKGNEMLQQKVEEHFAKYPKDFKLVLPRRRNDSARRH